MAPICMYALPRHSTLDLDELGWTQIAEIIKINNSNANCLYVVERLGFELTYTII